MHLASPKREALLPVIEGFAIERLLGVGAAGPVYLARQRRPERRVVLRVLPCALTEVAPGTPAGHELGLLQQVSHPQLARLYDVVPAVDSDGVTRPCLVLECVEGRGLAAWCERAELDLAARVALLALLARALHPLHVRGLIHGSLEAHQVLVSSAGEPKVLDAGLARWRALDADATPPPCRAPEQHAPQAVAADLRADVHALGWIGRALVGDPALPRRSRARRQPDAQLWAVLDKACAVARDQRYGSALEFALDLEHWLARRPVSALRTGRRQALRLWMGRHPRLAGLSLAAVLAGSLAVAWSLQLARSEGAALARANARAQELAAANHFLGSTLLTAEPGAAGAHQGSIRKVLDQARTQLLQASELSDGVDIRIRALLGETYASLGDTASGLPMQEEAAARAAGSQDVDPLLRKQVTISLARTLANAGQAARATTLLQPLLGDPPGKDPDSRLNWLRTRIVLTEASMASGNLEQAGRFSQELGSEAERWFGPLAEPSLSVRADRIMLAYLQGRYREVLRDAQHLGDEIARTLGAQHPVRAGMLDLAGLGARELDNLALARRLFLEAAEVNEALYGADAPKTLDNRRRVAELDHGMHPAERAPVEALQQVMQAEQRAFGPDAAASVTAEVAYASAALDLPDAATQAEGERRLQEVVDRMASGVLPRNLSGLKAEFALARHMEDSGRSERALQMYREVRTAASQSLGPQHQLVFRSGAATAQLLEHLRLDGEARQEYADLLPRLRQAYGEQDPRTRRVAQRLAVLDAEAHR